MPGKGVEFQSRPENQQLIENEARGFSDQQMPGKKHVVVGSLDTLRLAKEIQGLVSPLSDGILGKLERSRPLQ